MGNVVTTATTYSCPHGALGTIPSPSTVLNVDGSPVINKTEASDMTISGCPHIQSTPVVWIPCTAITSVAGESTKLQKNGSGVILDNNSILVTNSKTDGVPDFGIISFFNNQTKLTTDE